MGSKKNYIILGFFSNYNLRKVSSLLFYFRSSDSEVLPLSFHRWFLEILLGMKLFRRLRRTSLILFHSRFTSFWFPNACVWHIFETIVMPHVMPHRIEVSGFVSETNGWNNEINVTLERKGQNTMITFAILQWSNWCTGLSSFVNIKSSVDGSSNPRDRV